ncbi:MAG: hypothetical protein ABIE68_02175 [bacterium]
MPKEFNFLREIGYGKNSEQIIDSLKQKGNVKDIFEDAYEEVLDDERNLKHIVQKLKDDNKQFGYDIRKLGNKVDVYNARILKFKKNVQQQENELIRIEQDESLGREELDRKKADFYNRGTLKDSGQTDNREGVGDPMLLQQIDDTDINNPNAPQEKSPTKERKDQAEIDYRDEEENLLSLKEAKKEKERDIRHLEEEIEKHEEEIEEAETEQKNLEADIKTNTKVIKERQEDLKEISDIVRKLRELKRAA